MRIPFIFDFLKLYFLYIGSVINLILNSLPDCLEL
jgi:hypothetical protein